MHNNEEVRYIAKTKTLLVHTYVLQSLFVSSLYKKGKTLKFLNLTGCKISSDIHQDTGSRNNQDVQQDVNRLLRSSVMKNYFKRAC